MTLSRTVVALAVGVVLTLVGTANASTVRVAHFKTPSGNIICSAEVNTSPTLLSCTVFRTEQGRAIGLNLVPGNVAEDTDYRTDAWFFRTKPHRVLQYGTVTRFGPFVLRSEKKGLTVRSGKHGFFASREYQFLW